MLTSLALATTFTCLQPVAKDGDNVVCGTVDGFRIDMRLAAIDAADFPTSRKYRPAPKANAWCDAAAARTAKARLAQIVATGRVTGRVVDASPSWRGFQPTDRYGRPVVRLTVGGRDISEQLLAERIVKRWP